MTYNPGSDLRDRYPDWVMRHRPLLGLSEVLCRRRRVILIEREMSRSARLCAEAHAVAHLDLGHADVLDGVLEAREEAAADLLAARRLLPIGLVTSIAVLDLPPAAAAEEAGVTPKFWALRKKRLHPSERAAICRAMARREGAA